jgi:hypothetical protein
VLLFCYVFGSFGAAKGRPTYAVLDIVSVLMSAVVLVLLYRPRSNRYFHLITVARHAGQGHRFT